MFRCSRYPEVGTARMHVPPLSRGKLRPSTNRREQISLTLDFPRVSLRSPGINPGY